MSLPESTAPTRSDRPIGISILTFLHFTGGLGMVVFGAAVPVMVSRKPEIADAVAAAGYSIPMLLIAMLIIGGLAIGSAIGMWRGARWGWYLGSFYYAYSIVRNISAIANVYLLFENLPVEEVVAMQRGPEYHYWKFSGRLFICALLFLYFFKENVLEFFGLTNVSRLKVVLIEFGICVVIAIAFTFGSVLGI
jgi:hypothetical protein